jgi:hypothetical protein
LGHYCWVCGRSRPNEQFSGKGHARHVCKKCARLPQADRDRVQALLDIEGFLNQRNISAGNIERLRDLAASPNEEVRRKAAVVLEVALTHPRKRRRYGYLARNNPSLVNRLMEDGLLPDHALSARPDVAEEVDAPPEKGEVICDTAVMVLDAELPF